MEREGEVGYSSYDDKYIHQYNVCICVYIVVYMMYVYVMYMVYI